MWNVNEWVGNRRQILLTFLVGLHVLTSVIALVASAAESPKGKSRNPASISRGPASVLASPQWKQSLSGNPAWHVKPGTLVSPVESGRPDPVRLGNSDRAWSLGVNDGNVAPALRRSTYMTDGNWQY